MTIEKPWAGEFDRLLSALPADWKGATRTHGSNADTDFYLYPEYEGTVDSVPVRINISEFPGGTPGMLESGDNVEYLRVLVSKPTRHSLRVSPERIGVKVLKFLGLEREFETGNPVFDRKYLLRADTKEDERLLSRVEFQDLVAALDPFALLTLAPEFLLVSRLIAGAGDLDPERAREFVEGAVRLHRLSA